MLTEGQTHLTDEEWQLALDKANNLIELYPDSEEVYAAKNWDEAISNVGILMGKSQEGSSEAAEAATIVADATEKGQKQKKNLPVRLSA